MRPASLNSPLFLRFRKKLAVDRYVHFLGRIGQLIKFNIFGAADDTRAADDRPPAVRRPSTGRPTTVHGTNCPTVPSFSA